MPMKLSATELQSLVDLLTKLAGEIGAIEVVHNLRFGGSDVRPRIEYFHDAVRAFTSGSHPERLTVERLSYDVAALRYLQEKPLASLNMPGSQSPSAAVAKSNALARKAPDRTVKDQLSELYQQYGVLFTALLRPVADRDFLDRQENLNEIVEQCAALANSLHSLDQAATLAYHLDDPEFRQQVLSALQQKKNQKAASLLGTKSNAADAELKTIDKAHADYSMAQLGMYEAAKDTVKHLASQGFALAGRFVQDAMAQAARAGRGR